VRANFDCMYPFHKKGSFHATKSPHPLYWRTRAVYTHTPIVVPPPFTPCRGLSRFVPYLKG